MRRPSLALLLLLVPAVAAAQAYKWTDPQGTVHYSQTPPPNGTSFKLVTPSGIEQPAPAPAPAEESDAPAVEAGTAPLADTPENRAKFCASIKANLDLLKGKDAVVMQQEGRPVALGDAQRKQQIEQAQEQERRYCGQ